MWRAWNAEQRVAAVAASLLIVSTLGPFSWVELAIVLVGVAVLLLLRRRAQGRPFHLPFGDGTVIAAAGAWSALLILIRLFDRPLGQGMLALACAGAPVRRRRARAGAAADGRPAARPGHAVGGEAGPHAAGRARSRPTTTSRARCRPTRSGPSGCAGQKELPGMDDPNPYEVPEPKDPPAPDDLPAGRG